VKDSPACSTPPPKGPASAGSSGRGGNVSRQNASGTPNSGGKSKRQQKNKKKSFDDYWSKEEVQRGLKQGTLIEGTLRINPKNYEDAYLPHPDMKSDVYIAGTLVRNRALNADVVAVEILPREEWRVLMDDLPQANTDDNKQIEDITDSTKAMSVEDTPTSGTGSTPDSTGCASDATAVATPKPVERLNVTGSSQKKPHGTPRKHNPSVKDFLQSDAANSVTRRLFGSNDSSDVTQKMAAIPDKCLLRTGRDNNPNIALFSPLDHRVPRIQVPISECPEGFLQRANDFKDTLYIARITEWDNTSYAKG
ncbi:hypothetical protein NP493_4429g00004, partial [Ridgeia piscesae]